MFILRPLIDFDFGLGGEGVLSPASDRREDIGARRLTDRERGATDILSPLVIFPFVIGGARVYLDPFLRIRGGDCSPTGVGVG